MPKTILSTQTPQNTPPDAALLTKKTRSSPTHQNTGTSPLTMKPKQANELTSATRGKNQNQRELQTCNLQKGDPKHSMLKKNEKTEKYAADEGAR